MDLIYFFIDFILYIDVYLVELVVEYGVWVYVILFLILFCEIGLVVMLFLLGDLLLFVVGVLVLLEINDFNVYMMVVLMLIVVIVGDVVNYIIGWLFGEKLFSNFNLKIFCCSYFDKIYQFYEKYGGKMIIFVCFVLIVRMFVLFVVGMGYMLYCYFVVYNVIGVLLWVLFFIYVGYFFGIILMVQDNFKLLIVGIIVVFILLGVIEIICYKCAAVCVVK